MKTIQEFINSEIALWGEDYIFDLIDRGFEPILVNDGNTEKWTWLLKTACAQREFVLS